MVVPPRVPPDGFSSLTVEERDWQAAMKTSVRSALVPCIIRFITGGNAVGFKRSCRVAVGHAEAAQTASLVWVMLVSTMALHVDREDYDGGPPAGGVDTSRRSTTWIAGFRKSPGCAPSEPKPSARRTSTSRSNASIISRGYAESPTGASQAPRRAPSLAGSRPC